MTLIHDILQYTFLQRALLAGTFIALSCALLGVFLVLRRMALIGDGLAHASLAALALGLLLNMAPLLVSLPLVMLAALGIMKLVERDMIYGDAAIGLIASTGIALGVLIASIAGGFNVDLFSYLFGSILAVSSLEVILAIGLSLFVIVMIRLFYYDLFICTFDEEAARVSGIKVHLINKILILLTAMTIVLGIKVVGTMLVSSLIVFPPITALQIARGFKAALLLAALIAVVSVTGGILISILTDLPTGATIVLLNGIVFCVAYIFKRV